MFCEPESSQEPVWKLGSLIANLRREYALRIGGNGGREIIRPKDFFVNSFGDVDEI